MAHRRGAVRLSAQHNAGGLPGKWRYNALLPTGIVRNPGYWQQGRPYLDTLIFKSVGGDEAAYEAMLANEGQIYEGMSTPALLKQAAQHFNVENQAPSTVYDLQLNTLAPPFGTISDYPLAALIAQFTSGKWQAMVQTAGAYDPAGGVGVGFRFMSGSPFSGVHDPHLDSLLNQAMASLSTGQRCSLYNQAAAYIAQKYYGPFYFAYAPANVAVKNVVGPGLTDPLPTVVVQPAILWEDVAYSG